MAQKTHAIIGTGETSKKALHASLGEILDDGDAVSLVWSGSPTDTVEALYDYILDHEIEFTMFYSDDHTPPKVFRLADNGVTQKSRNPIVAAAKSVAAGGKVLILWDDEEQDDYVNASDAVKDGTLFLELSNGLAPLAFADPEDVNEIAEAEEEEIAEEEEAEEEVSFTREELLNMPAAAVKRYGAKAGCKAATKGGIIDEIFPEGEEAEDVVEEEEEPAPLKAGDKVPKPEFTKHSNEEDAYAHLVSNMGSGVIAEAALSLGAMILESLPFGRERALAITKLEETVMWAEKAQAD